MSSHGAYCKGAHSARGALRDASGSEVRTMEDSFRLSLPRTTRALERAIAVQTACAQHNQSVQEPIRYASG